MKRLIALKICIFMVLAGVLLTACGSKGQDLSDSKYVGTWKLSSLALQEESETFDQDYTLILNGDGSGKLVGGEDEDSNFTWELTKDGFKTKGDTKLTFKDSGENIKANIFGVDLIFERADTNQL